ncbi:hypothetical protein QFZ43_008911 [Streptomyces afghaniensis]|nr:hypothetical protein [Streptomyces afghaniensis]
MYVRVNDYAIPDGISTGEETMRTIRLRSIKLNLNRFADYGLDGYCIIGCICERLHKVVVPPPDDVLSPSAHAAT